MKKENKAKKKENPKKRFSASEAGLAFKHGFYLETVWILSMILEKKTKNYLSQIDATYDIQGFSFEQCISRIRYLHKAGRIPAIGKHIDIVLIDGMRKWKSTRNKMLKDMILVHVSQTRMERVALDGIALYKKWNKALKNIKNEIRDQTKKEELKNNEVAGK